MKTLALICLIILFSSFGLKSAKAQEQDDPVTIDQVSNPGIQQHNSSVKKFGIDYLFAIGTSYGSQNNVAGGNTGVIRQYGNNNEASLTQSGNGNQGVIQMGNPYNYVSENTAKVIQDGQGLISIVNMQGNNNFLDFKQTGNKNGALFNFSGSNLKFNATQSGAGLQLTPKSSTRPAIKISSTRRVLPVVISNN